MDEVGEVKLGRQRAPQHHHGDHMRPYLRVANVFDDKLDLSDVKQMNFTPKEFETYALRHGDILLNEGQTPDLVGRAAMYRDEIPGCCYQKTLLRFRPYTGINREYALIVFRAYLHNGRFRRSASITTNIAHLPAERFVRIEFPVPSRAEQNAIEEAARDQLVLIDEVEAELARQGRGTSDLRQAILSAAFAGRLVPQDGAEEPASKLLERLRAGVGVAVGAHAESTRARRRARSAHEERP